MSLFTINNMIQSQFTFDIEETSSMSFDFHRNSVTAQWSRVGKNTQNSDLKYDFHFIFLLWRRNFPSLCKKFETNRFIRSREKICQTFKKSYCIASNQFQEEIDHFSLNMTNLKTLLHHIHLSDLQNLFFI